MKNNVLLERSRIESSRRSPASGAPQHRLWPRAALIGWRRALPSICLGAAFLAQPATAIPLQWEYTGSLNTARIGQQAALLSDGKVLVAGGSLDGYLASAELYDRSAGSWTFTGDLNLGRTAHTATLLPDGEVLVSAGVFGPNRSDYTASAELYNPTAGTWTFTGSLVAARYSHAATLLPNGKVLVSGGFALSGALASAELYDPATGMWTATGSLNAARSGHTQTVLSHGIVLVAGGSNGAALASAELYDPATGQWTITGSLNTARGSHTATLLPDGKVLVAAGNGPISTLASAELYDPVTGNWSVTGSLRSRAGHSATLLPTGKVLVAGGDCTGGQCIGGYTTSAQLFDPATGKWTDTGRLNSARSGHTATLLASGELLAAGGTDEDGRLASAELYDPGIAFATTVDGQGTFDNLGNTVTFKIHATQGVRPSGSVTFSDPAAGISFTKAKVRTLTFNGNSADLGGTARLGDGTRVTYSVTATDNSSSGSPDTFSITLSNGYSASGSLTSGDIQIQ